MSISKISIAFCLSDIQKTQWSHHILYKLKTLSLIFKALWSVPLYCTSYHSLHKLCIHQLGSHCYFPKTMCIISTPRFCICHFSCLAYRSPSAYPKHNFILTTRLLQSLQHWFGKQGPEFPSSWMVTIVKQGGEIGLVGHWFGKPWWYQSCGNSIFVVAVVSSFKVTLDSKERHVFPRMCFQTFCLVGIGNLLQF